MCTLKLDYRDYLHAHRGFIVRVCFVYAKSGSFCMCKTPGRIGGKMVQIKNLTITHRKDLRIMLQDFCMVINDGDKAVIIGEEGNGKSTLLKWIYEPQLTEDYTECQGERILGGEKLGYLPQELPQEEKKKSVYEYFSQSDQFFYQTPKELGMLANRFHMDTDFFYSNQQMETLSGGEKIKVQLMRILIEEPTVLLLDEPSNDIDIETLELLEQIIVEWEHSVLFISHDETLIEHTANMIIHLEQIMRKTRSRYTIVHMSYEQYVTDRMNRFEKEEQQASREQREKTLRDEKYQKIMQSVEHAQNVISRQCPSEGRLLKKKMHAVKSMEKRFEKADENMTDRPVQEEAIFFKLGNKTTHIPAGKTVLEYSLEELKTPDDSRVLARNISLKMRGPEKICIIGTNGTGKTTLLKRIAEELLERDDINAQYMPQNYEEFLNPDMTPVDFLDTTGDKEERTKIRTYLGSLKYTTDEMEHCCRELSGGQKAKILLLKMSLSGADVLILDEPTRNFSPLSGPVIRQMIKTFPGAVISISHDRKYIEEVCDKVYQLSVEGLKMVDL